MGNSLITVKAAAKRLSLSEGKVYQMAWRKELPAVYIGRSLRIPESALDELINKNLSAYISAQQPTNSDFAKVNR